MKVVLSWPESSCQLFRILRVEQTPFPLLLLFGGGNGALGFDGRGAPEGIAPAVPVGEGGIGPAERGSAK